MPDPTDTTMQTTTATATTAPLLLDLGIQLEDPDQLRLSSTSPIQCDRAGCTYTLASALGTVVFRLPRSLQGGAYRVDIERLCDGAGELRTFTAVGEYYHLAAIGQGETLEIKLAATPTSTIATGAKVRRAIHDIKVRLPGGGD